MCFIGREKCENMYFVQLYNKYTVVQQIYVKTLRNRFLLKKGMDEQTQTVLHKLGSDIVRRSRELLRANGPYQTLTVCLIIIITIYFNENYVRPSRVWS